MALSVEEPQPELSTSSSRTAARSGCALPPARRPSDAVLAFFDAPVARSLYLRFHGIRPSTARSPRRCSTPTGSRRGALAGWLGERVVALANYVRLRDPGTAEVAFAVADDEQGRGVGTRLLEQLAARAARGGIERFVAEVLAENRAMLGVFADAGFDVVARARAAARSRCGFPIAPTEAYRARVDERDHVAVAASLRPFFAPRDASPSIGASRRRGSIGGELFRNILDADFDGAAYPVNRGGEPVAGVRGYRSIAEIPDDRRPRRHLRARRRACSTRPRRRCEAASRALCVISAGFAETGAEGRERQEQLLALVRAHGARLIGPNCLGIAVRRSRR